MNTEEFNKLAEDILEEVEDLFEQKGKEYAPPNGDRLWGLKEIARRRGEQPEQICRSLVTKHIVAIDDHVNRLSEDGNTVVPLDKWREWLRDEIVYAILLEALLTERDETA
jgi:hypothetical protein